MVIKMAVIFQFKYRVATFKKLTEELEYKVDKSRGVGDSEREKQRKKKIKWEGQARRSNIELKRTLERENGKNEMEEITK